ncbi:Protein of unknown function [Pyronema omphalodes CBS 100304]|uniref:Uncharacterized protein n=1 Tax=Pyronema omphalodes (strain CBS 100304) TaxID=1076935 RepID=U4LRI6_PYROM|nr:Protein of unknown function [Pyronema omphalodes CBS 100304]
MSPLGQFLVLSFSISR